MSNVMLYRLFFEQAIIVVIFTSSVQNKCVKYWPELDEGKSTATDKYPIYKGTINVTLKDETTLPSYIKRVFEVVKQQVRTI